MHDTVQGLWILRGEKLKYEDNFKCPYCQGTDFVAPISGHADIEVLRCDMCSNSLYDDRYDPLLMSKPYDPQIQKDVEAALNPCLCGGSYSYRANQRCKHCNHVISSNEIELQGLFGSLPGNVIDGSFNNRLQFYLIWKNRKPWG